MRTTKLSTAAIAFSAALLLSTTASAMITNDGATARVGVASSATVRSSNVYDSNTGILRSVSAKAYVNIQNALKSAATPKEGAATLTVISPLTGQLLKVDAAGMNAVMVAKKMIDDDNGGAIFGGDGSGAPGTGALTVQQLSISASPSAVDAGGYTYVSWVTQNVSKCSVSMGARTKTGTMNQGVKDGPINEDRTYKLTCVDSSGKEVSKEASVTVNLDLDAPEVTAVANPDTIDYNTSTNISWSALNAKTCNVFDGARKLNATPVDASSTTGVDTGKLVTNKSYTVECTGPTGKKSADVVDVKVNPAEKPVVTISADPSTIEYNTTTKITWSATDANACTVTGPSFLKRTVTGDAVESIKLTKDAAFIATCSGPGGKTIEEVAVTVNPAAQPTAELSVDNETIATGAFPHLSWKTTGAVSCQLFQNGTSISKELNGTNVTSRKLAGSSFFGLICSGPGGTVAKALTVQVNPTVITTPTGPVTGPGSVGPAAPGDSLGGSTGGGGGGSPIVHHSSIESSFQ